MSQILKTLFEQEFRCTPLEVRTLQAHASERKLYRLIGPEGLQVCGIENPNITENKAFIYFAKHFRGLGLPAPEIYIVSEDEQHYLEQDLGDTTLFTALDAARTEADPFPSVIEKLYEQALTLLPAFQTKAAVGLDFSYCSPVESFNSASMLWDMNFFKEAFLKKIMPVFNEALLAKDFNTFVSFLDQAPAHRYFMYRDFQSRNIMVKGEALYFIDFQGGRRGPLQYDVASLLYQASARIPVEARDRLLNVYLKALATFESIDEEVFRTHLGGFIAIRMMQVLGTYGKQGLENKKEYFLKSIPRAVENLFHLSQKEAFFSELPELTRICYTLLDHVKSNT